MASIYPHRPSAPTLAMSGCMRLSITQFASNVLRRFVANRLPVH